MNKTIAPSQDKILQIMPAQGLYASYSEPKGGCEHYNLHPVMSLALLESQNGETGIGWIDFFGVPHAAQCRFLGNETIDFTDRTLTLVR
ncbi:MAG: hypothetical protein HQL87_07685 [Magnetococcales bacterium]|nr:hypothetical protein [Magnetococcales bacterium]